MASEVDRYCSWPGHARGYKFGHSEVLRQRARAQAALGPRYDLRDFNDTVVKGGDVPLDVLAKNLDAYIEGARTGAGSASGPLRTFRIGPFSALGKMSGLLKTELKDRNGRFSINYIVGKPRELSPASSIQ